MALTFGAAISDRVDIGSGAFLDNLDPFTLLAWVYPTSLTDDDFIYSKGANFQWYLDAGGAQNALIRLAPTDMLYASNTNALVVNSWQCLGLNFNSARGAAERARFYYGTLAAPMVRTGTTVSVEGSGTRDTDAADAGKIGNYTDNALVINGRIAAFAVFAGDLTLDQMRQWQRNPLVVQPATRACFLLGEYGTGTQIDYSGWGNHGTVTGATRSSHDPLMLRPYGWQRHRRLWIPEAPVGAGQPTQRRWGGIPFMRLGGPTFGGGWHATPRPQASA